MTGGGAPDWVKPFFDTAATWWRRPEIRDIDRDRAAAIERLCGAGPKRVLELGAGGGATAAASADLGHNVTAVELSPVRAAFARELAEGRDVTVVEGDLYTVELDGTFDCVTYWNGFGVGTDDDQRRLLRRIATTWLGPGASLILEVFSPWRWARAAGHQEIVETRGGRLVNARDYDPVRSRFVDRWWPEGEEGEAITQWARCYTPADLLMLLETTRLEPADGDLLDSNTQVSAGLWDAWMYRVRLVATA